MIPLPPELEKVEKALKERKMTGSEASEYIFASRKKLGAPRHWKSWKLARKKILGAECETCGAGADAILYVQHTVRNPRLKPYIEAAEKRLAEMEQEKDWRPELKETMREIRNSEIPELRNCCPICSSLSIQYRKGTSNWICNSKSGGKYCRHVFVEPDKKAALTANQKKNIKNEKYAAYREVVLNREHDVKRDALLEWFEDFRRYLSLKDTKTLCKSRAYIEDLVDE